MSTLAKELLQEFIDRKEWGSLRKRLRHVPAPELADFLREAGRQERIFVFRSLPKEHSADVFSSLEPEEQDLLLRQLTDQETRQLLSDLDPDDRTALLEELPGAVTRRLMTLLSPTDLAEARQLLGYPEESVGRLMTPDYVAVRPEWTVGQALDHIRTYGRDSETINIVYVTDEKGKLLDDIRLRKLILARPGEKVSNLMDGAFMSLSAFDDREEAVRKMREYDHIVLPVADSAGMLVGIVTVDDVMDVAEEEVTEDIQKAASVSPLRTSYRHASVWALFGKRVGWLVVLVLLNLVSAAVIAVYEDMLARVVTLLFFIPILIGTAGNAGSQAATLVIRALVTGDLTAGLWGRTLAKEIAVGVLLGVSLGLLGGTLGLLRSGFDIDVALTVGLSMLSVVIIGNLVGMTLPFVMEKMRFDPAVASGPLITTMADATGLLVYFLIATAIIGW
jgi:magnesium transporter